MVLQENDLILTEMMMHGAPLYSGYYGYNLKLQDAKKRVFLKYYRQRRSKNKICHSQNIQSVILPDPTAIADVNNGDLS